MSRFNQLFGTNLLSTQITNPSGGLQAGFPTGFLSVTKPVNGNVTSWTVVGDTRDTGTITAYGNPATRRNLQAKSLGKAVLMHTSDQIAIGQEVLNEILTPSGVNDDRGEMEIARQTSQTALHILNSRVASIVSMLAGTGVYVSDKGQIVDSTYSGAVQHVDFGIPAANTGNLGGIITAKWDIAATAIATQFENIQRQRIINGTPPLRYCGYGPGVMDALLNNTIVAKMLTANNVRVDTSTQVIEGLFGMIWYPLTGNFLKSTAAGAFVNPFAKKVVMHPQPTRDWYEMQEGSYVLAGSGTAAFENNASEIAKSLVKVQGAYSIAKWETNPMSIVQTYGDTWLPVMYQPSAIYIPTVLT